MLGTFKFEHEEKRCKEKNENKKKLKITIMSSKWRWRGRHGGILLLVLSMCMGSMHAVPVFTHVVVKPRE